jgi:hypothetical protein
MLRIPPQNPHDVSVLDVQDAAGETLAILIPRTEAVIRRAANEAYAGMYTHASASRANRIE